MAGLQVCIGMSEPLLIVYVISFSFSSTGSSSELRTWKKAERMFLLWKLEYLKVNLIFI